MNNLQQDTSSEYDSQAAQHEVGAVSDGETKVVTQNRINQSVQHDIAWDQRVIGQCQKYK